MSGGVDSSLSAALLKLKGYEVVGVFIRTWQPEWLPCSWKEERRDAMRVCAQLRIPFYELNLEEKYRHGVVEYMINEYRKGRVPNPDVMCNKEIKFGAFYRWARNYGADYIATGHYARVVKKNGKYLLLRGKDERKDQSYFLWTLNEEILAHTLFPISSFTKSQVRFLSRLFQIRTAKKPDSQGICFLGEVDMKSFLSNYIREKKGDVLDEKGRKIGEHPGAFFFTLGERHGFSVTEKQKGGGPYYVIGKNIEKNILIVSQNRNFFKKQENKIYLHSVNNISHFFKEGMNVDIQYRYHSPVISAKIISFLEEEKKMILSLKESFPINFGQSLVLYQGNICLGGGIITQAF